MQKKGIWMGFFVGLVTGLALTSLAVQSAEKRQDRIFEEFFKPLAWPVHQIDQVYVDDVDLHKLLVGAYQGMMWQLDRYCAYFPPDTYEEFKADTTGEFGGLGMEIYFDPMKKAVVISHPIPGTPAFRAGLMSGDMIIEVQQEGSDEVVKTEDFSDIHDALKVLRGKKGTKVTITVIRQDPPEKKQVTIKREIIHIPSIRGARTLDEEGKIGYIYIAAFHERLLGDLKKELKKMQKEGVEGVILDLRFNPGGLLQSAKEVSDMFLDGGVIVSTKGRVAPLRVYNAEPGQDFDGLKVVLLVNRNSASAAEIVTAALHDHGRAVVVGEHTYGKASVQTIIENPSGQDAIKLTTAHYYTPRGELIEKKGVEPDINVELSGEDLVKLTRHLSRTLDYIAGEPETETPEDAAEGAEEEEPFEDVQLQTALTAMQAMLAGESPVPAAQVEAAGADPALVTN